MSGIAFDLPGRLQYQRSDKNAFALSQLSPCGRKSSVHSPSRT